MTAQFYSVTFRDGSSRRITIRSGCDIATDGYRYDPSLLTPVKPPRPEKRNCGEQCVCGGKICGTRVGGGKHTQYCTCCGQRTFGRDRVSERGPKAPAMHKPTHTCRLNHIYGHSYFGSGGAHGTVKCCDNCCVPEYGDNGFVSGATAVRVIDWRKPASFVASGGDCIGRNGRQWSESGEWCPKTRRWI